MTPLVSAVIFSRGEKRRVTGKLLGRLTRSWRGGEAVAAEIEVLEPCANGLRPTGRITLAPIRDVEPVNGEARAQMEDDGDPPRTIPPGAPPEAGRPGSRGGAK